MDITIHGRDLHFIKTVAPHGRVYANTVGDHAIVSHNPDTNNVFGSLTTHEGRTFYLEKCKSGQVWKELSVTTPDDDDDEIEDIPESDGELAESRYQNFSLSRNKRSTR